MVPDDAQTDALDELERAQSALALDSAQFLPGAFSNKELDFVREANLNLDAGPESNRRAIAIRRAIAEREILYEREMQSYFDLTQGQDFQGFLEYWETRILPTLPSLADVAGGVSASPGQAAGVGGGAADPLGWK